MKKLILPALLAAFISGQASAEYLVQYGQNQISGDNIKFVTTAKWLSAEPFISEWVNDGGVFACSVWSPLPNTVGYGTVFQQSANDCQQKQTRNIQQREQNNITHEYRNSGNASLETQTLTNQHQTRSSTGTLVSWVPAAPLISDWFNENGPFGCSNWTPLANTVTDGVSFKQDATDCQQVQKRTVQKREQNNSTLVYRNVDPATTETQIINNQSTSRTFIGTKPLDDCSYVYGHSTTMSAWIANDKTKDYQVWWKGTQLLNKTSTVQVNQIVISGFKYVKTGSYIDRSKRSEDSWYQYFKICREPV